MIPSASFGDLGPLNVTGKLKNKKWTLCFYFHLPETLVCYSVSILSDFQSIFLHVWKKAFVLIY